MNKGFRLSPSPLPKPVADIISSRHGESTRHKQERRPHTKEDLCLRGSTSGEMHEPLSPTRRIFPRFPLSVLASGSNADGSAGVNRRHRISLAARRTVSPKRSLRVRGTSAGRISISRKHSFCFSVRFFLAELSESEREGIFFFFFF